MNYSDTKIQAPHLKRRALIYVRQSSMRQVLENRESTARQYALADKAVELGWMKDLIEVIDDDLGKSASSARDRGGFQRLVANVAMGHVGIVMGLEMSRLARNNADFQQLLQICGTNNTLIYDADAVYDLMRLNDRLVLGLKGTMSEAELFTIRARLQGGALNKASRGELKTKLPIGFVYSSVGKVAIDPDKQVQETIRMLFSTFRNAGSAKGVVRHFSSARLRFPVRPIKGRDKGELTWRQLSTGLVLRILHNPRYAGAFSYGRTKLGRSPSGGASYSKREREQWHALVKDAHASYISWNEFEEIQTRLAANACRVHRGAVREGSALLQGVVICGKCGKNFATSYKTMSDGQRAPVYLCNRDRLDYAGQLCTYVPGEGVDGIVTQILLERVTPAAAEAGAAVQREIVKRAEAADKLLQRHVERARYEADLARRRVMSVDPENRLVAQTFEQEWNEKLSQVEHAKLEYERRRGDIRLGVDDASLDAARRVTADFAGFWARSTTNWRDKKRIVRLLLEDVTLRRSERQVQVFVRFKTGFVIEKTIEIPLSGAHPKKVDPDVVATISELAEHHTAGEIAAKLNEAGKSHPSLDAFDTNAVTYLCRRFNIKSRWERLRDKGFLSQEEVAAQFGVVVQSVHRWRRLGWVRAERYNDLPEYLYEPRFDGIRNTVGK